MKHRWIVLFICFLTVFVFLSSMQAAPPLLAEIIAEYNLTHAIASMLMLLVALPAVVISILGGILVDRYGTKNLITSGLALVSTGNLLTTYSTSFLVMGLGRLVIGIGGTITFVSTMALVSQIFSHEERGLAMGVFGLTMPLATVFSFNLLGGIGKIYTWRVSFLISLA